MTSIKQFFQLVWNEFIYSGHLEDFASVSIVFTSALLLGINISWKFLLICYLVAYVAYSHDRLSAMTSDSLTNFSRTEHIKKSEKLLQCTILGSIVTIFVLLVKYGNFYSIIFVVLLILGSLLYPEYFKNFTKSL